MNHYNWMSIPGHFRWPEIYDRAVRIAPQNAHFVELGCNRGQSTYYLAMEALTSNKKKITIHAVDLWEFGIPPWNEVTRKEFQANLRSFGDLIQVYQTDSSEAAKMFEDDSVDFVFVDADHSYDKVLADIKAWWPKIRYGGWMAGDDLIHGGVRKAVEEFFGPECTPGKTNSGRWSRFQSMNIQILPTGGGYCWYTEQKE